MKTIKLTKNWAGRAGGEVVSLPDESLAQAVVDAGMAEWIEVEHEPQGLADRALRPEPEGPQDRALRPEPEGPQDRAMQPEPEGPQDRAMQPEPEGPQDRAMQPPPRGRR